MLTDKLLSRLRERVRSHVLTAKVMDIDPSEPTTIVRAPVQAGISRFIDVSNLPSLDDLPFIPERMRDFAFRYSTEYMPNKVWAKTYNVTVTTIENWLRNEGVRAYIAVCRYEQRMFNLAQHVTMQRNVYKTINAILTTKITADTIGAIVVMSKFVYQILHDPQTASDRTKGVLNVNIGFGNSQPAPSGAYAIEGNPYARSERNVTPKKMKELQSDIAELEILAQAMGQSADNE